VSWKTIKKVHSWQEFVEAQSPLRQDQRGKVFELLTELYLQIDPIYRSKLKHVWHESNLPTAVRHKLGLPSPDIGVDLVAESNTGEYWAIQCKYHHDPNKNLVKNELNSFLDVTTRTCKGKFSTLLAVTSAHDYSINLEKFAPEVGYCLSDKFQSLDEDFFRQACALILNKTPKLKKRTPRPHQQTAIKNAVKHFVTDNESRGKLIHPCGTGKSLIGYWVAEALDAKTIIVALPSLYLVRQTLADWTKESLALQKQMDWMVVCSEATIGDTDKGDPTMRFQEIGVDVTTDVDRISKFLGQRSQGQKVIFTTYQSGTVTAKAARKANQVFDVGIFDEAHRTVGQKDSLFSHLIDEDNIRIRKRVFMTATERRYQGSSDTILSMDDVDAYGDTFDKMTFKEALEQKPPILSDYKIVTMVVARSEIQHLIDENFLVKPDKGKWDDDTEARSLAALIALRKVMQKNKANHALTFHNSIAKAEAFKESQERFNSAVKGYGNVDCFHVSSKVSTGARKSELEKFKASPNALITNAKCLTEGVDVPTIDAVLFADTKRSTVDIVQAAGRALRPAQGKKMGYIVVPVLVDENDPKATDKAFQDILVTLRAMASNDDRIIDYFRSVSQGKRPSKSESIIDFDVPDPIQIKLEDFIDNIETQTWHRLARLSWMPFEEAREFARSSGLGSFREWNDWSAGRLILDIGKRPPDIPAQPGITYRAEWISWSDWLGGRNYKGISWRSFIEARDFVRSLQLKSSREYVEWISENGKKINDIPSTPVNIYVDDWLGWGDWLGTGNVHRKNFRPFNEARIFTRSLGLKNHKEWQKWCKNSKPDDIPTSPSRTYKADWVSFADWLDTDNIHSSKKTFRSFQDARQFARSLKLSNITEWFAWSTAGHRPKDIPAQPGSTYESEWKDWSDWLGTGNVYKKDFRAFTEARKFAQSLELKSFTEWSEWRNGERLDKDVRPDDIPYAPNQVYRGEWISWPDWLGYGFLPFAEARDFARSLRLTNRSEWIAWSPTSHRPDNIPSNPNTSYKEDWISWEDWLGESYIDNHIRSFRSFGEARDFVQTLKLNSYKEWRIWISAGDRPIDIPTNPKKYYNDEWTNWGDWFGVQKPTFRRFSEAREFARSLGLNSSGEWQKWCSGDINKIIKPDDIPLYPATKFKNDGWIGWGDWLGTGRLANSEKKFLPFIEAREFTHSLDLKTKDSWMKWRKMKPEYIPGSPERIYKEKGWNGWGDWLGTGAIASFNREYLPFTKAREFAHSLKLKNSVEWRMYCKGDIPSLPIKNDDIPNVPYSYYKGKGWISWPDWLGNE
jgi:superfamily II DNA or RNA helicase